MRSLIIWLPDGQTLKFEDVRFFTVRRTEKVETIEFNYWGVSTAVRRNATFEISKLIGWGLELKEEEA